LMNAIGIDRKVSSLWDFEEDVSVVVRRLKPTVNKVLSLRDISLLTISLLEYKNA